MQTFIRAILYIGCGLVAGALFFCAAALLPLGIAQQDAAVAGAVVGGLVGLVFGITRRFQ